MTENFTDVTTVETETDRFEAPVLKNNTGVVSTGGFNLPDPAEVARRAELTKQTLVAAYKVLSYSNITLFGDNVYVDADGSKKIANLFGLIIRQNEVAGRIDYRKEMIDEVANHYIIHVTGRVWHVSSPENYEVYEGTADSFDDWYRQWQIVKEETVDGKTKKIVVSAQTLPVSKVEEKATANLLQRCVKKKLGLKFTVEELQKAGFEISKVKGFNFNGGSGADSQELVKKRQDVWNKLLEICDGDIERARKTLKENTAYKDFTGHTDINKVKETQLNMLAKNIDKYYKDYLKQMGVEE